MSFWSVIYEVEVAFQLPLASSYNPVWFSFHSKELSLMSWVENMLLVVGLESE